MKLNLILLNFVIFCIATNSIDINSDEPIEHRKTTLSQPKRFPLLGLEVAGLALLTYVAKKMFNLCRPEIERDVDHAIETTVPEVKEEIDKLLGNHSFVEDEFDAHFNVQAIEKELKEEVKNELDHLTRRLSRNILKQVGNKLTKQEIDTLHKYN